MTIALQGNAQGGIIQADGVAAANVSSTSGLPFCKNKLFNGEVTRINQRQFDGNWATKPNWGNGTIAQNELSYGYDMWAKASATDMMQFIEAGDFRPNTVHTISGLNMTTRQETSPASGNWAITVPQNASNVQVEEGLVATPFEIRPISFELAQCQRYYILKNFVWIWDQAWEMGIGIGFTDNYPPLRTDPIATIRFNTSSGFSSITPALLKATCTTYVAVVDNVGPVRRSVDMVVGYSAVI